MGNILTTSKFPRTYYAMLQFTTFSCHEGRVEFLFQITVNLRYNVFENDRHPDKISYALLFYYMWLTLKITNRVISFELL